MRGSADLRAHVPGTSRLPPSVRRFLARYRRLLAALLTGLAVLLAVSSVVPQRGVEQIWVAAEDLAAGSVLTPNALTTLALPAGAVPAGVLHPDMPITGRRIAA